MAAMLGNLYEALTKAGASAEDARKASEEVAAFKEDLAARKTEIVVIKWMVGFVLVIVTSLLGLTLRGH